MRAMTSFIVAFASKLKSMPLILNENVFPIRGFERFKSDNFFDRSSVLDTLWLKPSMASASLVPLIFNSRWLRVVIEPSLATTIPEPNVWFRSIWRLDRISASLAPRRAIDLVMPSRLKSTLFVSDILLKSTFTWMSLLRLSPERTTLPVANCEIDSMVKGGLFGTKDEAFNAVPLTWTVWLT